MNVLPYLGLAALILILAVATRWFWRAWQVNIPKQSGLFRTAWAIGLVLGCIAYYQSPTDPFALWAIALGLLFLYLVSTGAQKISGKTVNVGDALPSFAIPDETGSIFNSSNLIGKPVLLKFFRGHW